MRIKNKNYVIYPVIAVVCFMGWQAWNDKPYCRIEHQVSDTVRGKTGTIAYILSKVFVQKREIYRNEPYALYLYVQDRHGIRSIQVAVNGRQIPLNLSSTNPYIIEEELEGIRDTGVYRYTLDVMDNKGKVGHSECIIRVYSKDESK